MSDRRVRECERYAETLLDFAEGRPPRPETQAALTHLGRCGACQRDLTDTALVIVGLRRLGAAARRVEPPRGAWSRVRARLAQSPRPAARSWHPARPGRLAPSAGALLVPVMAAALVFASSSALWSGVAGYPSAGAGPSGAPTAVPGPTASGPVAVGDVLVMGGGRAGGAPYGSGLGGDALGSAITPGPSEVSGSGGQDGAMGTAVMPDWTQELLPDGQRIAVPPTPARNPGGGPI